MPKAESNAGKRKANYKKNVFTQQWAEGRYTKNKGKGKADDDNDADEPKVRQNCRYWKRSLG
jgi:hypothetical protein